MVRRPPVGEEVDVQDLTGAVEGDAQTGLDGLQPQWAGGTIGLAHVVPDRRILVAHPPDGITEGAILVRNLDLVVERGGVEKPDDVFSSVIVLVLEIWIERVVVHRDRRIRVVRQLRSVVEGHRLGLGRAFVVLERPVVAPRRARITMVRAGSS